MVVEVKNVSKSFKNREIFKNVSLSVKEGTIVGITGENGCGKTVLFKMICGFMGYQSGCITVFDKYIGKDIDVPENTGIIIETPGFMEEYNQMYNLKYLMSLRNQIDESKIIETLKKVGLDPNNKEKIKKFSLGMRQKLAIAQAIMENQKLLILDEPMNALDQSSVNKIRELLLDLKREGKTILMASHLKDDIDILCDEVYNINNYKIEKVR